MIDETTQEELTCNILHELDPPFHWSGYRYLCIGIPCFAQNPNQSMGKELYPTVAEKAGCLNMKVIEPSMRRAIVYMWEHGSRAAWGKYFPGIEEAPSNMVFIATLAEYVK